MSKNRKEEWLMETNIKEASSRLMDKGKDVKAKILELYDEIFAHNGYGEINVDMRILKRGQKEIIIHCGKQYRFVVDWENKNQKNEKRLDK